MYSLPDAVREVLDTTSLADPDDVAAKVAENVPSNKLRTVVRVLLPAYVREHMRAQRASNPVISDAHRTRSARSSKVAAIRAEHERCLRDRVFTDAGWKLLGECTYENLVYAANARREDAERNMARAAQYDALAAALQEHGVATVGELPATVVHSVAT